MVGLHIKFRIRLPLFIFKYLNKFNTWETSGIFLLPLDFLPKVLYEFEPRARIHKTS